MRKQIPRRKLYTCCPACAAAALHVYGTRHVEGGYTIRRYRCKHCGASSKSTEQPPTVVKHGTNNNAA